MDLTIAGFPQGWILLMVGELTGCENFGSAYSI